MTLKALAAVLVSVALAAPAYAQSENVPPNAVEDQSFAAPRSAEPPPADTNVSYVFEQKAVPPESQGAIPMAPRTGKGTETQPVDRATLK